MALRGGDYEVGYGKPPKENQFKKGRAVIRPGLRASSKRRIP
jgi:hypothetical protein